VLGAAARIPVPRNAGRSVPPADCVKPSGNPSGTSSNPAALLAEVMPARLDGLRHESRGDLGMSAGDHFRLLGNEDGRRQIPHLAVTGRISIYVLT
jgi:hypothetical protein